MFSKKLYAFIGTKIHRQGDSRINTLLLAGIFINIAIMLYFVLVGYRYDFHSDAAAANLLAQEIYDSGDFFPRDWQYVNGDLWVIFMHAWMVPILIFVKNGYTAHALAAVIGCALVLLGTRCIVAMMQFSVRARLLTLLLISSGLSANFSENIYGQQAYGTIYFICCFILYTAWRFLHSERRSSWIWALVNIVLTTLATMSNPQRAAIYFLLPSLISGLLIGILCRDPNEVPVLRTRLKLLGALTIGAVIAGAVLHRYFLNLGHSSLSSMPVLWLGFDAMLVNAFGSIRGLLSLLVGLPSAGVPMSTPYGAMAALRLISGLTVLFLFPWAVLCFLKSNHRGRQFVAAAGATSFILTLFVFITSTVTAQADPEASIRYVVPGLVLLLLILVGMVVDEPAAAPVRRIAGITALVVLVFSAPFAYRLQFPSTPEPVAGGYPANTSPNANLRLAYFLQTQGLKYGYSTFWNAGRTTVLSESEVRVRQLLLNGGALAPYRFLSAEHWYEPGAWHGRSFLLLSADEAKTINWVALFKITGKPQQQLTFENYLITTFDHNISINFPEWGTSVHGTARYIVSELTPHVIGKFSDGPPALTARKGEQGILRYGPYQRLSAGRYRMQFKIRTEGDSVSDFGFVDIIAAGGLTLATERITKIGDQNISLTFSSSQLLQDVEFRVFASGSGAVTFYQGELSNE